MPKVSFRMASASRESVFGVQTSTARKVHRSDHTEGPDSPRRSGCNIALTSGRIAFMVTPPPTSGLRDEARKRADETRKTVRQAGHWARWHQLVYYAPIVIGVLAGAVGGFKGVVDDEAEIAGWAAAIAGVCTALSLKFNKDSELGLATLHWKRHAGFKDIAQKYQRLAIGGRDPTDED